MQRARLTKWDRATLLQRVWGVDALKREGCGDRVKFVAVRASRRGADETRPRAKGGFRFGDTATGSPGGGACNPMERLSAEAREREHEAGAGVA